MLAPGETIDPGIIRADLDFTAGMKRHYAASSPSASRLPSWTTFGVVWGTLVTWIGASLGAALACALARRCGWRLVDRLVARTAWTGAGGGWAGCYVLYLGPMWRSYGTACAFFLFSVGSIGVAAAVPYGPSGTLGPPGAALRTCSGVSNCYVCSPGSCTPSGSWQSRIENASPGDTILLQSGAYTPRGGLSIPGGAADGKIVIANHNGSAAVIAGPVSIGSGHVLMEGVTVNSPASSFAIHVESRTSTVKQNIELKNMDILGGTGEAVRIRGNVRDLTIRNSLLDGGRDNHTIKVLCDDPSSCSSTPENITITNNKFSKTRSSFYPASGEDLLQFEGAGNATVTYNEFGQNPNGEDCVDWKSQGRSGTSILFSFNRVNECNLQGILFHQGQANGNTTIEGNYFEGSDQLMRRTHARTKIINNIIDGNQFVISASSLTLAYNTFMNRGNSLRFGDTAQGAPQNLTIINNIFSGTGFSCSSVGCGSYTASYNLRHNTSGSFTCANCPAGNPLLSEYQIQSGSPARDAASGAFAVAKDLFGTSRPQGSAPDIGAHEINSIRERAQGRH